MFSQNPAFLQRQTQSRFLSSRCDCFELFQRIFDGHRASVVFSACNCQEPNSNQLYRYGRKSGGIGNGAGGKISREREIVMVPLICPHVP